MSKSVRDNNDLLRGVQDACDEIDRQAVENAVLQKQKEDAEYVAELTQKANEELVKQIRDLNYKSGLYGVAKKDINPRNNSVNCNHECNSCSNYSECKQHKQQVSHQHNGDVNVRFPWIKEHKPIFLLVIGIIVVLLLASGFTPTGEFWTNIQDQWLTLIADLFRLILVAIVSILIYIGIIKK